jgi:predicted dehydrogenase
VIDEVRDLHFVRPRSPKLLWTYWRELGVVAVARKVRSRLAEQNRNQKFVACGVGTVIESPAASGALDVGSSVAFVAPCHPRCVDRVVLPPELVFPITASLEGLTGRDSLEFSDLPDAGAAEALTELRGWSPHSGITISAEQGEAARQVALRVAEAPPSRGRLLLATVTEVTERAGGTSITSAPNAVLFGWGNYAKTTVVPRIGKFVDLGCVHELDPTQIPRRPGTRWSWDTAPEARLDEHYDVHLIAGFHHTHAPLACQALAAGAHAVVEKPVATTELQLEELLASMQRAKGALFACFHKRYLPFNTLAMSDLRLRRGEPLSYHCVVFEEPLPALHWYRWPNSRSRLTSNGCHWIDHFLFLNGYVSPAAFAVTRLPDGSLNCSMSLENGASFTMVLTDNGSRRLGVQDHVELRANGATVTIRNGAYYQAEDGFRVLRRKRISRLASYDEMYRSIGARIRARGAGDMPSSVEVSTRAVLRFEEELRSTGLVPR